MKTINLFKTVACAAMVIVSVMNSEAKAEENNFRTNEEVKNELVVAKDIFRQEGTQLYRHTRYEFEYNAANQTTAKTTYKWSDSSEAWMPYSKMTYQYSDSQTTLSYAFWNEEHSAYDKEAQKSVYELDAHSMPVVYKVYKQTTEKSDWTMVNYHRIDYTANTLAMTK